MAHPYELDPNQLPFYETAERVAKGVLREHARVVDRRGRYPEDAMKALSETSLLGLFVPSEIGGQGRGLRLFAAMAEAFAQECSSTAMIFVMHVAATQAIVGSTTLARRDEVLAAIARGAHLTTLAFSERGSRSQFWAPMSQMVRDNGEFVVSADKSWVTGARYADSFVASAQQPDAASPLESTLFLVSRERRRNGSLRVMAPFDGLGLRGNDSSPVAFEQLRVAGGDLLTPLGQGAPAILQIVLPWFNIGTAAMANGLCKAAVAAIAAHLQTASFEQTATALRDLPTLRARLADMSLGTEQAVALLARTLDEVERQSAAAPLFVLETRLASIEAALEVTDLAMKAGGGAAFSRHLDIERLFRDARAGWVMAPTADHLREFIGRALTGMPLF
jgi:alkylation response protein AidB-like acyl-CoA dehydrogenase